MGHLAQFNIARARWDLNDPRMAGFMDNVARVNQLAERSPGYVWRLEDETGPEAPQFPDEPRMTFTLSVWESLEALRHFTFNTIHKQFRARTSEWFEPLGEAYLALWPVAEGHHPDGVEALTHLALLRSQGPSAHVFGTETLIRPV
ncbi:MAG: DUF3291 domain-containing protein [Pikeienuella sp.]